MKKAVSILVFFLSVALAGAQISFKTIVPQQPLVTGESFQVQYVIEDGENASTVKAPAFYNFRFVTGPNTYLGSVSSTNGMKPAQKIFYHFETIDPGKGSSKKILLTNWKKGARENSVYRERLTLSMEKPSAVMMCR